MLSWNFNLFFHQFAHVWILVNMQFEPWDNSFNWSNKRWEKIFCQLCDIIFNLSVSSININAIVWIFVIVVVLIIHIGILFKLILKPVQTCCHAASFWRREMTPILFLYFRHLAQVPRDGGQMIIFGKFTFQKVQKYF